MGGFKDQAVLATGGGAGIGRATAVALPVWFVMVTTDSHLSDIGGPIDVIVIFGVAAMGAICIAILVYTLESLFFRDARGHAHRS